jgi:hypothetical protein
MDPGAVYITRLNYYRPENFLLETLEYFNALEFEAVPHKSRSV